MQEAYDLTNAQKWNRRRAQRTSQRARELAARKK